MSLAEKNVTAKEKKTVYCEDSTDSENETERKALLRRISTSKCVGRLPVVKEGFLMKQTRSFQRWQRRYFRLRGRTFYYAKEKDSHLWDELELEDVTFAECSINNANNSFQVITSSRVLVLCAESRSEMESWADALRGALHCGGDVADLVARLSCRDHQWYAATHARPTFCNVCREPFGALGTAHALACELCKFRAHKRCAARAPPSCKWSTLASLGPHLVEDAEGNIIMPHQWLEGNLPVAAKCDVCDKTCGSVLRLQDFRCVWCRKSVHAACKPSWRAACSLGGARASIVPPTRLHSVGPDDAWVPDRPTNASPLIVFVNSRSGDNQGVKFLRRFKQLLNPAQVFELSGGGPRLGLRLFRHFAPLRVLVCSGDGSVGWVLQEIDHLDMHRHVRTAVLPLGTGNDLARVLGWGASCDDAANLQQLLERYERASTKMLDRWSIMTFERPVSAPPPPPPPLPDIVEEGSLLNNLHEIMQPGEVSTSVSSALRTGCAQLAAAGERAGGGAARAALRLRRAVSMLLHARAHLSHDHTRCRFWEPADTASDSESEAPPPVAEKGSIEKTEKEQLNWAARGCALAGHADSVRRALRSLGRMLAQLYPQGISCETCAGEEAAAGELELSALPVPRAFADSRRSSTGSAISAASLHPDKHLGQRVQLECDGQRIPLPELQGIVVLNISSFMGGTNFWGGTRADDIFLAPSFDDRILEVVAVFGSAQMAASRLINLQKHRIAQCRAVQINILGEECVPVQVDGEAWLQPPGCVRIIHKNRAQMMCRSRTLETSLSYSLRRVWDEKQQMKAHAATGAGAGAPQSARAPLSAAENTALLALLEDVNTIVKHVKRFVDHLRPLPF